MDEDVVYIPVESSNVQEIGYDDDTETFFVKFSPKGNYPGTVYAYYGVEPEIYEQFMMSPSKGKFVWTHLRDRYEYERIYEF